MEENMNPQVQPVTKTEIFPKTFSTPKKEIKVEPTPKVVDEPIITDLSSSVT